MNDRQWLQLLFLLQWVATASAVVCALASIRWSFPLPFFACMFTWQATVIWCRRRLEIDGRNVWERAPSGADQPRPES